ncbi:MAG: hypothetical protein C4312_05490, partial [Thermoflexus sp.]
MQRVSGWRAPCSRRVWRSSGGRTQGSRRSWHPRRWPSSPSWPGNLRRSGNACWNTGASGGIAAGERPTFPPETEGIRRSEWRVAPPPPDLQTRWVEITGPTDRKMIINALNSGAQVFMADFEDANVPTWSNLIEGQQNLREAVRRT